MKIIKKIALIPKIEMCNISQVANFYKVTQATLRSVIKRNREELTKSGMIAYSGSALAKKITEELGEEVETSKGKFTYKGITFSNRGNTLFSTKAIIHIGLLLRDSQVAKAVRLQLLELDESLLKIPKFIR